MSFASLSSEPRPDLALSGIAYGLEAEYFGV